MCREAVPVILKETLAVRTISKPRSHTEIGEQNRKANQRLIPIKKTLVIEMDHSRKEIGYARQKVNLDFLKAKVVGKD